jgi:GH25 family lysozyme M1 (1,4-beta-N-acetylmuramidase)
VSALVKGIDVSSWSHPEGRAIDWEEVAKAGYRFVIVKASQGAGYENPWAARDLDDARAAGLLVGAYHYFEAGTDPGPQAMQFLRVVANQVLDLGLWCDWECYEPVAYVHNLELATFRDAVRDVRGNCGVYADQSWADQLKADQVGINRLWVASWDHAAPVGALIWQSAPNIDVPGVPGLVDEDLLLTTRGVDIPTAPAPRPTGDRTALKSLPPPVEPEVVEKLPEEVTEAEVPAEV